MRLIPMRRTSEPRSVSLAALARKIFYGLLALIAIALVFAFDATWPLLQDLIITVVEFIEQEVDVFFAHTVGLSHYYAQMATAWLGFFILLTLGILMIRKAFRITRQAKAKLPAWREHQKEVARSWWQHRTEAVWTWWSALRWPRRIALVMAALLFAIPFFWALSLVLATLISLLI